MPSRFHTLTSPLWTQASVEIFYPVPNLVNGGKLPQSLKAAVLGNKEITLEVKSSGLLSHTDILIYCMTFPIAFCEPQYLYLHIGIIISIFPAITKGFKISQGMWQNFCSCVPFPQYGLYRELTKICIAVTDEHIQVCVWRTEPGCHSYFSFKSKGVKEFIPAHIQHHQVLAPWTDKGKKKLWHLVKYL